MARIPEGHGVLLVVGARHDACGRDRQDGVAEPPRAGVGDDTGQEPRVEGLSELRERRRGCLADIRTWTPEVQHALGPHDKVNGPWQDRSGQHHVVAQHLGGPLR